MLFIQSLTASFTPESAGMRGVAGLGAGSRPYTSRVGARSPRHPTNADAVIGPCGYSPQCAFIFRNLQRTLQTPQPGSREPGTMSSSPPRVTLASELPSSEGPSSSTRGPLAGGRQITRNRASYSCHTCRRRKVKCDKVRAFSQQETNCGHLCLIAPFP